MAMPGIKILRRMFGLDWRSLALMRMGLALVLLVDLAVSAQNLRAFYTDAGVLPREMVQTDAFPKEFSVHMLGGGVGFEGALFALEGLFALMMLVGYRTRLETIGCGYLLLSRQARAPLVLYGADMIEHIAFFWALWLPLNRRFSLDAAQGRVAPPTEPTYVGVAGIGAIIQFMLIYMMSALMKTGPSWTVDHTAVQYALSLGMYARSAGQWLNQFDGVTAFLTVYTVFLELYGPLLLIFPWGTGRARLLGCLLLGTLQLGFGVCMQMGLFWVAMNAFMLMLLPAEFWTWLAEPLARRAAKWLQLTPARAPEHPAIPPFSPWRRRAARGGRWLRDGVILAIMAGMILAALDFLPNHEPLTPPGWNRLAGAVGLDQSYAMFAPDPQRDDGWFVARGWFENGNNVDVLTGASPANFDRPEDIAATYLDQRWGSYYYDLLFPDYQPYLAGFAEYLGGQWNDAHPAGQQLKSLEIIFMHQIIGPHHTVSTPQPAVFWTEYF